MSPPRVLVIDDSLTVRKLVEMALAPTGYSLDFASSGGAGLERARSGAPDVILLDFVLPDMRGADVCRELEHDPQLAAIPVLLMSGRPDTVRAKLAGHPSVVGFVAKPFSAEEIAAHIAAVLRRVTPSSISAISAVGAPRARGRAGAGHPDLEQAARAVYARIRDRLALLPTWAAQAPAGDPAPHIARRLLTPDVMEALLEALAPTVARLGREAERPAVSDEELLVGDAASVPLVEVLRALATTGRSGELTLGNGPGRRALYLRHGKVVLATCFDPILYLEGTSVELDGVPAAARALADAEQRRSGKPLLITLHEEGVLAGAADAVAERTRSLVAGAIGAREGTFAFADGAREPAWVEGHARPLAVSQAVLERLRRAPDWSLVEQAVPSLEVVLDRATGFSRKMGDVELDGPERELLALVDGRTDLGATLARAGVPLRDGLATAARLCESGLAHRLASDEVRAAARGEPPRPVLVHDPDQERFVDGLRAHLARASIEVEGLVLGGVGGGLANAVARSRPRLVLYNADDALADAAELGRARAAVPDVTLVAVLEERDATRVAELERGGFDRVLVKPVHFAEVDAVLARGSRH